MENVHERNATTTSQTFAAAMRERDFETLGATLADDVVLHSPITGSFPIEGREQVVDLLRIVRQALEDLRPVAELGGDDDTHALMFEARIGRQKIQALDVLRFDAEGRIREFRIFIRPLPGLTALAAALAPEVAARGGRGLATLVGPPARMQAFLARVSDRVAVRMLRRSFSRAG
jgi:ketosteroid isomerase-like protein